MNPPQFSGTLQASEPMLVNSTQIVDTYAEAFTTRYARLIVTAINSRWLRAATDAFCGYGSSVIGCDAEVGVENWIDEQNSPDGRVAASILAFGFSVEAVAEAITNRCAQTLMTCPTTTVFNGLPIPDVAEASRRSDRASSDTNNTQTAAEPPTSSIQAVKLGSHLRYFGDGFQKSKLIDGRRFWRIPVMDGEFIVEDAAGVGKGVAGGNFLIQSRDQADGIAAAERAVDAIAEVPGVITPFPGGVARSGSKVGSRYSTLKASTAHAFGPTLRGRVETELADGVNCVYEIIVDGVDFESVAGAMRVGIEAASGAEAIAIAAGNYGGKLGKHLFHLHSLFSDH